MDGFDDPLEPFDPRGDGSDDPLFLARNGGKKGDLSRLVDEAVRRYVFDLTVDQIKERNAEHDQDELLKLIDDEVDAARAGRS